MRHPSEGVYPAGSLRADHSAGNTPRGSLGEVLGHDVEAADVVVTKIGYLEPTLHDLAAGWTLALTPGGVDQDLARLGHHRIRRPMHPFDDVARVGGGWEPDLAPVVLRGPARLDGPPATPTPATPTPATTPTPAGGQA